MTIKPWLCALLKTFVCELCWRSFDCDPKLEFIVCPTCLRVQTPPVKGVLMPVRSTPIQSGNIKDAAIQSAFIPDAAVVKPAKRTRKRKK